MVVIDIILVVCFLPAIFFGLKNGLVKQLVSVCVIFFGIKLSIKYAGIVSERIINSGVGIPEFWTSIISFILIFTIIAIVFSLLGRAIEKVVKITLLGWLNKLLGLILSCFVFLVVISVLVYFVNSANLAFHIIPDEKIAESRIYPVMLNFAQSVFPLIKSLF